MRSDRRCSPRRSTAGRWPTPSMTGGSGCTWLTRRPAIRGGRTRRRAIRARRRPASRSAGSSCGCRRPIRRDPRRARRRAAGAGRARRTSSGGGTTAARSATASRPTTPRGVWPVAAADQLDLDVTNLGFAANAHLDPFTARAMRDSGADLFSLKIGINIVSGDTMKRQDVHPRRARLPRHPPRRRALCADPGDLADLLPDARRHPGAHRHRPGDGRAPGNAEHDTGLLQSAAHAAFGSRDLARRRAVARSRRIPPSSTSTGWICSAPTTSPNCPTGFTRALRDTCGSPSGSPALPRCPVDRPSS